MEVMQHMPSSIFKPAFKPPTSKTTPSVPKMLPETFSSERSVIAVIALTVNADVDTERVIDCQSRLRSIFLECDRVVRRATLRGLRLAKIGGSSKSYVVAIGLEGDPSQSQVALDALQLSAELLQGYIGSERCSIGVHCGKGVLYAGVNYLPMWNVCGEAHEVAMGLASEAFQGTIVCKESMLVLIEGEGIPEKLCAIGHGMTLRKGKRKGKSLASDLAELSIQWEGENMTPENSESVALEADLCRLPNTKWPRSLALEAAFQREV